MASKLFVTFSSIGEINKTFLVVLLYAKIRNSRVSNKLYFNTLCGNLLSRQLQAQIAISQKNNVILK